MTTFVFTLWLLMAGIGATAWAQPLPTPANPSQTPTNTEVKGDVLYWEEEELVVREISGHQVRLKVTPETKIQGASGRLKSGDKIAATVAPNVPALSITVHIPDSGAPLL